MVEFPAGSSGRVARAGRESNPQYSARGAARNPQRLIRARREFFTALTNPKALLLFAAFVPQFVTIRDAAHLAVAGIAYIGVEAVTASGYIVAGQRLGRLLHDASARRRLDRTSSAAYLGLAGWLALERRP